MRVLPARRPKHSEAAPLRGGFLLDSPPVIMMVRVVREHIAGSGGPSRMTGIGGLK